MRFCNSIFILYCLSFQTEIAKKFFFNRFSGAWENWLYILSLHFKQKIKKLLRILGGWQIGIWLLLNREISIVVNVTYNVITYNTGIKLLVSKTFWVEFLFRCTYFFKVFSLMSPPNVDGFFFFCSLGYTSKLFPLSPSRDLTMGFEESRGQPSIFIVSNICI